MKILKYVINEEMSQQEFARVLYLLGYRYIARDKNRSYPLRCYINKPHLIDRYGEKVWGVSYAKVTNALIREGQLYINENLFQEVKDNDKNPTAILDLLGENNKEN